MTPYKNLSGISGIEAYEIGDTSITVRFKSGKFRHYRYDHSKPGPLVVKTMKELAIQGKGLNSLISRVVKLNYSERW